MCYLGENVGRWLTAIVLLLAFGRGASPAQSVRLGATELRRGEANSKILCGSCHLWPSPDLLGRETWAKHVLPVMSVLSGHTNRARLAEFDYAELKAKGVALPAPLVSDDDFLEIARYYLQTAPTSTVARLPAKTAALPLEYFEVLARLPVPDKPATSMAKLRSGRSEILVGDAGSKTLRLLSLKGGPARYLAYGLTPVEVEETEEGLFVASIGSIIPTERKTGAVFLLPRRGSGYGQAEFVLRDLPRVSDLAVEDINGDGRTDLAVAMFGWFTGRLSWFERMPAGTFEERPIFDRAGATKIMVRDWNGDGRLDVVALIAQGMESLVAFIQDKQGGFTARPLIQHHPAFGSSGFDLADFNRDGRVDVVLSNGDFDYGMPERYFHGVRVFLNFGKDEFEERYYFPLSGAYQVQAADFDLDGDQDIAVVSFTPSFRHSPVSNFFVLENEGEMKFSAKTFPGSLAGRWLRLDAEDYDRDGDVDIALGSYYEAPGIGAVIPPEQGDRWLSRPVGALVLRNKSADVRP
jgi:hypothetical protein